MARKQTLVQRIALDGGKDIRKELEALGAEGKAAFEALKRAADDTTKAGTGLNKFLRDVQRDLRAVQKGAQQVASGLGEIAGGVANVGVRFAALTAAATAAGTGLFLLTKNAADAADQVLDSATAAGLAVDAYGRLKFAFEQNGSSAEGLSTSFRKFNQVIDDAVKGVGPGAVAFQQLGISVTDAAGKVKPAEVLFQEVADAFAKLPAGSQKAALAIDLFGRSGAGIIQVLNQGGQGIRDFGAEATRLGFVLSEDLVLAGAAFNDSLDKLKATLAGVKNEFGLLIAPAFTAFFDGLTETIAANRQVIVDLGIAIRDQLLPLIADLFAILRGDDAAVANQGLLQLRDTVVNIGNAFNFLYGVISFVFESIINAVQPLVDLFNLIFGTKIKADVALFTVILAQFLGVFRLIGAVVTGVRLIFAGLVTIFGTVTAQIVAVSAAVLGLNGFLKTLVDGVIEGFGFIIAPIGQFLGLILDSIKAVLAFFGFIVAAAPGAVENVDEVKKAMGETAKAVEDIKAPTEEVLGGVKALKPATDESAKGFKDMGDEGESAYARIGDGIQQLQNNMAGLALALNFSTQKATELYQALEKVGGSSGSFQTLSGGGADSIQGLATGGAVAGPGTGTSDSILARLSNGEFVMRAAAVRRYGVRFLNALNSGKLPKGLRGFSVGGLVDGLRIPTAIPKFAEGGLATAGGGGRPVNLNIGGELFENMMAPEDVADRLVRFATGQKVRRAGNKPSWYGGSK